MTRVADVALGSGPGVYEPRRFLFYESGNRWGAVAFALRATRPRDILEGYKLVEPGRGNPGLH